METLLRNIVTLSVTINCSYDTAWEYLVEPINQKEWAVHFFHDIEKVNGDYIATLPFGKLPMEIKSERELGTLDIYLGDGKPIRTRLIEIENGICQYNFTLAQPKDMPDEVWNTQGVPNMQDELNRLKQILQSK